MKKVLIIYAVLIVAIAAWLLIAEKEWSHDGEKEPKEKALAVSKHSKMFNRSIEKVLDSYYDITKSFVKNDAAAIDEHTNQLKTDLDALNLDELKKDTAGIFDNAVFMKETTK